MSHRSPEAGEATDASGVQDVVIVGSGVAGLLALRSCLGAGLSARCLEARAVPGGVWSGHGVYAALQLQQHKEDFVLPGHAWPKDTPDFPSRDHVLSYISSYIEDHNLDANIQFRTPVESLQFDEQRGVWKTLTSSGQSIMSRFVAFAGGSLGGSSIPVQVTQALASFGGQVVHSCDYYRPNPFEGAHVVLLGYGASSVEIAANLAKHGKCASVTMVAPPRRHADSGADYEDWCLSRDLQDDSRFCASGKLSDANTLDHRNSRLREAMRARHPQYPECMPPSLRPQGEPLSGRIIVSELFIECVTSGAIKVVPGLLSGASETSVTVSHGGSADVHLQADVVIACTGYETPLSRIGGLMSPAPSTTDKLYLSMWSPEVPNAAFLGLGYGFVAVPALVALQATHLARIAAGATALPGEERMRQWMTAHHGSTQMLTDNLYVSELTAALTGRAGSLYEAIEASVQSLDATLSHAVERPEAKLSSVGAEISGSAFKASGPEDVYEQWAATYEEDSAALGFHSPKTCVEEVLSFWPQGAPVAALDIGCGTGDLVRRLKGRLTASEVASTNFFGFDLSDKMLDVARKRDLYTDLRQQSCSKPWPYPDASMDIAFCNGVLIYVESGLQEFVVDEVVRVLKPGGHAILMIREDNFKEWQPVLDAAEAPSARKWRMVHCTAPHNNFTQRTDGEVILYRQHVFQRLDGVCESYPLSRVAAG